MEAMDFLHHAGLASIRRAFSTMQLCPQQWSPTSSAWPQNLDFTALTTFQSNKSFPRFQELIFGHKFYTTEVALSRDKEEKDNLHELSKTAESPEKMKWELVNAAKELCQVLLKGDEDMEETLSKLGVQVTPQLAQMVFDRIISSSSAVRFFEWAKLQPRFKDDTKISDKLVNILGHSKDFETLQRVFSERSPMDKEDKDNSHELSKTVESPEKKKWELVDAAKEMCQVLLKGSEDMEATLSKLGVQVTPQLVQMVFDRISSSSSAVRFFEWAKLQLGFKDNTSTSDKLVYILGRSKDFETLQRVLSERSPMLCSYSTKTFSFATAWGDDSDMLNEVMEIFEKLELSLRVYAYEMLIAALCEENHFNAALEKMASTDCAPRMSTYRSVIQVYCRNNQMDNVEEIFEMMKDRPQDSACYHIVLSVLCNRKFFAEAVEFFQRMANMGCKPDAIAYNILIRVDCNLRRIQDKLKLFDRLKEEGITPIYSTYTLILGGLFEIRGFDEAYSFMIQHSGKDRKLDSSNYKDLIRACINSSQEQRAGNLMMEMKAKGLD